jgi:hypothetical protein
MHVVSYDEFSLNKQSINQCLYQIAEAPSVSVNRVATYRELDSDLLKHVAFATIDDIDLR